MTNFIVKSSWGEVGRRLESHTRKALYDYQMVDKAQRVAIALSGGKDSMTLLLMLRAILGFGFPKLEIHAIHVGGTFTCGAGVQLPFLEKLCEELGVNFTYREAYQDASKLECYSCSRERRRILFQVAKEKGCDVIAFGHHRDDNAQTVLMNLFHKGSFEGMLPKIFMHHYQVTILRPLIYASESEIRQFAQQQGFARIMCRCPVGQNSMRKQVEQLLSDLENLYPNVRDNVATAGLKLGTRKAEQIPKNRTVESKR